MYSRFKLLIFISFSFMALSRTNSQLLKESGLYKITIENASWVLQFPSDDFEVQQERYKPDGSSAYYFFTSKKSGLNVSFFIEPALEFNDARSYRDNSWNKLKPTLERPTDIMESEIGEFFTSEYVLPEYQGVIINQKNMNAHFVRDGLWIDAHLSKVQFQESDQRLFNNFVNSISIKSKKSTEPTKSQMANQQKTFYSSKGFFERGSMHYLKGNYENAKVAYQKALDMEIIEPTLSHDMWKVLVDNLGMAYGMTGDLLHAKEIFEYGLSKDSTYPLFYYNMACTYAEMEKQDSCIIYLKRAFDFQSNVIQGEEMPDPVSDSSFQRFLKSEEFKKALREINAKKKYARPN